MNCEIVGGDAIAINRVGIKAPGYLESPNGKPNSTLLDLEIHGAWICARLQALASPLLQMTLTLLAKRDYITVHVCQFSEKYRRYVCYI